MGGLLQSGLNEQRGFDGGSWKASRADINAKKILHITSREPPPTLLFCSPAKLFMRSFTIHGQRTLLLVLCILYSLAITRRGSLKGGGHPIGSGEGHNTCGDLKLNEDGGGGKLRTDGVSRGFSAREENTQQKRRRKEQQCCYCWCWWLWPQLPHPH